MPEAEGIADLLRSITGLDIRAPDRTRDSGLDPRRRTGLAYWRGALLLALPVLDEDLAARRLGLRLARLGFIARGQGGLRHFEDLRTGRNASLEMRHGVALVCVSASDVCAGPVPPGDRPWSPALVAEELGMPDADLVALVRNPLLVKLAGIERGPARILAALLGDARVAVRLEGGALVRVGLGASGAEAGPPGDLPRVPEGVAMVLSVALPAAFPRQSLEGPILGMCGSACAQSPDFNAALQGWTGAFGLVVLARPDAPKAPLVLSEIPRRLNFLVSGRFTTGADGAARLLGALLKEASVVAGSDTVFAAMGDKGLAQAVLAGQRPDLVAAAFSATGPTVARLILDPSRLAEAAGGIPVEFLRHVVEGIRQLHVTARFDEGRLLVDAGVVVR